MSNIGLRCGPRTRLISHIRMRTSGILVTRQQSTWQFPLISNSAIQCAALLATCIAGCGGGSNSGSTSQEALGTLAPIALNQTLAVTEDSEQIGILTADISAETPLTFSIETEPAHGLVTINQQAGTFTYTPTANFFGTDSFRFIATAANVSSTAATVAVNVENVNDPPVISAIPDAHNSPYTQDVTIPLTVWDADNDQLTVSATASNDRIVDAFADLGTETLTLRPKEPGQTIVQVAVSDGTDTVRTTLTMTVQDMTRQFIVSSSEPAAQAILLANTSAEPVGFTLGHNGHHAFGSMEEIVEAVRALPNEIVNEPFERKLWRFVRDNTYHAAPINTQPWMLSAAPTLNSFGWGFCSNVAATAVQIAIANGLQARMWDLNGHVVPEVQVSGLWSMYDSDLAVYYLDHNGTIAGVNRLTTEPTLISSPESPIFPRSADAYNSYVAGIYGSTSDNIIGQVPSDAFHGATIVLPPGAQLIYPGNWTTEPIGYDGPTEIPIPYYRQARLEIPAGTIGTISVPWVVADIQGTGVVEVENATFHVGDSPLRDFLISPPQEITEITILENPSGIAVVMFVNALWYEMEGTNHVNVTGRDVWALRVDAVTLSPGQRSPPPVPEELRKPQA